MTYDVTIPANTTATLYMPVAAGYELKESGQPVSECTDIEYLGIEDGKAVCRLGSGSYRFTVDNATGVNNVQGFNSSKDQEDIYNLQGYKIPNSQLSTLNPQLSNGVYIQGGRKMIK
jgi:alpha-L-rhamnosidase